MFNTKTGGAFHGFHHTGYVTTDLTRAIDIFKRRYGLSNITECGEIPVRLVNGKAFLHRTAMAFVGVWGVELIQPTGGEDSIYRSILPDVGFGLTIHHICYSASSRQALDEAKAGFVAAGSEIVLEGADVNFFYADTRKDLGHYTEWAYIGPAEQAFLSTVARC